MGPAFFGFYDLYSPKPHQKMFSSLHVLVNIKCKETHGHMSLSTRNAKQIPCFSFPVMYTSKGEHQSRAHNKFKACSKEMDHKYAGGYRGMR